MCVYVERSWDSKETDFVRKWKGVTVCGPFVLDSWGKEGKKKRVSENWVPLTVVRK